MKKIISALTTTLICLTLNWSAHADSLLVAVSSNFSRPMEEIADLFTESTGIEVDTIMASTGKLYSMIKNGAPFDIFLSADSLRPAILFNEGACEKPFMYAEGKPVLWASGAELCSSGQWQEALRSPLVIQVAIANPETAPYGKAAKDALVTLPDMQELMSKLVYTQNIGQTFQYAEKITGAGFTSASFALSEDGEKGCFWPVPEAGRIRQDACVLRDSNAEKEAHLLAGFLNSREAETVLEKFGYIRE